ncbi:hypothetical protein HYU16_01400 [Candidatus Woesearchaeota archaeon]|nr:hypothetical protein [Candidatus Woesearchaeota archaeon]
MVSEDLGELVGRIKGYQDVMHGIQEEVALARLEVEACIYANAELTETRPRLDLIYDVFEPQKPSGNKVIVGHSASFKGNVPGNGFTQARQALKRIRRDEAMYAANILSGGRPGLICVSFTPAEREDPSGISFALNGRGEVMPDSHWARKFNDQNYRIAVRGMLALVTEYIRSITAAVVFAKEGGFKVLRLVDVPKGGQYARITVSGTQTPSEFRAVATAALATRFPPDSTGLRLEDACKTLTTLGIVQNAQVMLYEPAYAV